MELDRAIKIIDREIGRRESMIMQKKHFLRLNELKFEVRGLEKALDIIKNVNKKPTNTINTMLVDNNMPEFGTKEFNNMCSNFFGGKTK